MKRLLPLITLLTFLLPAQAFAMTTPLLVMDQLSNITNASERDFSCTPEGGASGTGSVNGETPIPAAGIISNLTFGLTNTVTTGSYSLTLVKNDISTAQTCTISSGTTCSDSAHPISFAAGDRCSMVIIPTSTPTAQSGMQASASFDGTASGDSILLGGQFTLPTSGALNYGTFGYVEPNGDNVENNHKIVFPTAGTIDQLYVFTNKSPGAATSWTMTARLNGATTTLTCQVAGASATACNDPSHSLTVAAGDFIDVATQATGATNATTNSFWGVRFVPTIPGESVMLSNTNTSLSAGLNVWNFTGGIGNQSVENTAQAIAPVAFTWEKIYTDFDTAPGSGTSRSWISRVNTVSQSLAATVSDTSTAAHDTVDTVAVSALSVIDWMTTPTNAPAGSIHIRTSAVMFIAPPIPPVLFIPSKFRIYGGKLSIKGGSFKFR